MSTIETSQIVAAEFVTDDMTKFGRALLNNVAAEQGQEIVGDVEVTSRTALIAITDTTGPTPIVRHVEAPSDVDEDDVFAYALSWRAQAQDRRTAQPSIEVAWEETEDGMRGTAPIPATVIEAKGGEVNLHHSLGKPVTVTYLDADGQPVQALGMVVEIDDDAVAAEVPYGAVTAVVVPDED